MNFSKKQVRIICIVISAAMLITIGLGVISAVTSFI